MSYMSLKQLTGIQIDSKSKVAKFIDNFCSLVYVVRRKLQDIKRVSRVSKTFLRYKNITRPFDDAPNLTLC